MKTFIYLTILESIFTGERFCYIGKHTTTDKIWPAPGSLDSYIGSSSIAFMGRESSVTNLKKDLKWITTIVLQEVIDAVAESVESQWIVAAYFVFGVASEAKRSSSNEQLNQFKDGCCLNCHYNLNKNVEEYKTSKVVLKKCMLLKKFKGIIEYNSVDL